MELLCLLVIKEQSLLLVYPLVTLFIFQNCPPICFLGQLYELEVDFLVTNHGVDVQDPWTSQILGIGHKVGCMFEVHDLKISS